MVRTPRFTAQSKSSIPRQETKIQQASRRGQKKKKKKGTKIRAFLLVKKGGTLQTNNKS